MTPFQSTIFGQDEPVLKTRMPYQNGMPNSGISSGPHVFRPGQGVMSGNKSNGLPGDSSYPMENGYESNSLTGTESVNDRIPVAIAIDKTNWVPADSHAGAISFIRSKPTNGLSVWAVEYETLSLTRLNFRMKQPFFRKLYGSRKTAKQLMDDFSFVGIQTNNTLNDWGFNKHAQVYQLFQMGKRAIVCNYWAICNSLPGCEIQPGDRLYLVWRRYKIENEIRKALATITPPPPPNYGNGFYKTKYSRIGLNEKRHVNVPSLTYEYNKKNENKVYDEIDKENIESLITRKRYRNNNNNTDDYYTKDNNDNNNDDEYYWNLEPYISKDHKVPSPHYYSGPGWVGDWIFIGFVLRIQQGNVKDKNRQAILAHQILHTQSDSEDYKQQVNIISKLEIFVRVQ